MDAILYCTGGIHFVFAWVFYCASILSWQRHSNSIIVAASYLNAEIRFGIHNVH